MLFFGTKPPQLYIPLGFWSLDTAGILPTTHLPIPLPLIRWGVVHWTDGRFPGEGLSDLQEHGESLHHEDRNGPEAAPW